MALLTYSLTHSLTHSTCLLTYLVTYLLAGCLAGFLPDFFLIPSFLPSLHTYLLIYLLSYLLACFAYLPTDSFFISSAEKPDLLKVRFLQSEIGQNTALHASQTARNSACLKFKSNLKLLFRWLILTLYLHQSLLRLQSFQSFQHTS